MKCREILVLLLLTGLMDLLTALAQSVTTIYSFTNGLVYPQGTLALGPDGNFYGTTRNGGNKGLGSVFQVQTNGAVTTLVSFDWPNGSYPDAGLTLGMDGAFYGTTEYGMLAAGAGTVFRVTTNGTLATLAAFNIANGSHPSDKLTLGPDGDFYGTTLNGGSENSGTVFQVTTGGAVTTLVNFDDSNGANPWAGLALGPDGFLYGTTAGVAGEYGTDGTLFKVTTNGSFTLLFNFSGTNGAKPYAGLTLGLEGNLYGTTFHGGDYDAGTVFKVTTNGTLTTLVSFNNTNGAGPFADLTLGPDGNFYGTTYTGGDNGYGTIFQVTSSGVLTTLVSLNGTNGAKPFAGLTLGHDSNFYGTTIYGGSGGVGTIFQLALPPDFIISPSNQTVAIGGAATLNCQPFGTAPFAYQWLSNGIPIPGTTNGSLTFANVAYQATNSQFQVLVTNAWGSIVSSVATLTVLQPLSIYAISSSMQGNYTLYLASYPNSTNRLWATTDLEASQPQWQVISTSITGKNGLSQFMDTNTLGVPKKFYQLSNP